MSDIYLISKSVPCPLCNQGRATMADLASVILYSDKYKCYACGSFSKIKDWLGKYVGIIKDVKDEIL